MYANRLKNLLQIQPFVFKKSCFVGKANSHEAPWPRPTFARKADTGLLTDNNALRHNHPGIEWFVFRLGCLDRLLGVPFSTTHFARFYWSEEKERLLANIPVVFKLLKALSRHVLFLTSENVSAHQLNSTNDGPVLLFKTIFRHRNCFLSYVGTDGKDGYGFKLEKIGPTFPSFSAMTAKITKNYYGL